MELLARFLLESSLCLVVFYAIYHLLLRQEVHFQLNRFYLAGTSLLAVVIPFLRFPSPEVGAPVLVTLDEISVGVNEVVASAGESTSVSLMLVIGLIYTSGVLFSLSRLALRLFQLVTFIRQCKAVPHKGYRLIHTEGRYATFSFLNYLCWDNTAARSLEEARLIRQHELVHIRQKHTYELLLMELLVVLCWYNPLIYSFRQALKSAHEYIADREIATNPAQQEAYQQLLAKETLKVLSPQLVHSFFCQPIKRRLTMLYAKSSKFALAKYFMVLPVTAFMVFIFACSTNNDMPLKEKVEGRLSYDKAASYPGGRQAMVEFIHNNLEYPEKAQDERIDGAVIVQFVISADGTITEPEIVRDDIGGGCGEEVLKVIHKMPRWEPAEHEGEKVDAEFTLPVRFQLE